MEIFPNIIFLKMMNGLILFDLGSAVDLRHPNAITNFLKEILIT